MARRRTRLPHGRSQGRNTSSSTSRPRKTESKSGRELGDRRPHVSDGALVEKRSTLNRLSLDNVKRVGFLVNPIAGMGGAVGLKGTDGRKTLRDAVRKGAKPVSLERGLSFLEEVQRRGQGIEFLTAPRNMGASLANQLKLEHELVGQIRKTTTSDDSIRIARLMRRKRVDLIVFCGGDGTARDVLEGVGHEAPTLGVPAGVKIYSSVFAINPAAAAESTVAFLEGQIPMRLGEVVDVDEIAFRKNRLSVKLFGYLTTPDSGPLMQGSNRLRDHLKMLNWMRSLNTSSKRSTQTALTFWVRVQQWNGSPSV